MAIIHIEQNKNINPKNYEGYNGIWVLGEGILFDSEKEAWDYRGKHPSHNGTNARLFKFNNVEGKDRFVVRDTNVWD